MKSIQEKLISQAKKKDICVDGLKHLFQDDKEGLVDYFLSIPDWCLERNFPDLQTWAEGFSGCEEKGLYINKVFHGEMLNDLQQYVFHNCRGTVKVGLNVGKAIIPMLYFANGCRLRIVGAGDAKPKRQTEVPLYVFGHNDISAHSNKYVKFITYKKDLL